MLHVTDINHIPAQPVPTILRRVYTGKFNILCCDAIVPVLHAKNWEATLAAQRSEPVRKRFWDLHDFGTPDTKKKDNYASAVQAIYHSDSDNDSQSDSESTNADSSSAPAATPSVSVNAMIDYFKRRIKTYDVANAHAVPDEEPSMELKLLRKSLGIIVKDSPGYRCPRPIDSFFDSR